MTDDDATRISLAWYELLMAASIGVARHIEAFRKGNKREDGTVPEWGEDIEGAAAELAVAKYRRVPWTGSVNAFCEQDVDGIGVRHATGRNGKRKLIIRKRDAERYGDDGLMALVHGERGSYQIMGAITIGEARQHPDWKVNPRDLGPAYFVPPEALHPLPPGEK